MAGAVHDKSGRKCSMCPTIFTAKSFVGTITKLRPVEYEFEGEKKTRNYRIPHLVCRECHNNFYSRGED